MIIIHITSYIFTTTYQDAVSDGVDLLEDTPLDVPFRCVGAVAVRLRQTDNVELRQRTCQCFINRYIKTLHRGTMFNCGREHVNALSTDTLRQYTEGQCSTAAENMSMLYQQIH